MKQQQIADFNSDIQHHLVAMTHTRSHILRSQHIVLLQEVILQHGGSWGERKGVGGESDLHRRLNAVVRKHRQIRSRETSRREEELQRQILRGDARDDAALFLLLEVSLATL